MANVLTVKLEDKDISTSHKIFNDSKLSSSVDQFETRYNSKYRPIIVCFTVSDKMDEMFLNRLNNNAVEPNTKTPTSNSIPSNFTVRENLTSFKKYLLNKAKKLQRSLNYKFVSTLVGQIFLQQDNSRAKKISTLRDLDKLECPPLWYGFSNY